MWLILVLGLLVVVPLVGLLFDDEDWRKWDPLSDEFWEDIFGEETEPKQDDTPQHSTSTQDVLTLRTRYAAGELTDEQFERKLERLLETETPEDVEELLTE